MPLQDALQMYIVIILNNISAGHFQSGRQLCTEQPAYGLALGLLVGEVRPSHIQSDADSLGASCVFV